MLKATFLLWAAVMWGLTCAFLPLWVAGWATLPVTVVWLIVYDPYGYRVRDTTTSRDLAAGGNDGE